MRLAILFPHSPAESQNSGVSRLEMFDYLPEIKAEIYHFGPAGSRSQPQYTIGRYYPEADPRNLLNFPRFWWQFRANHRRQQYQVIWATMPPLIMVVFGVWLSRWFRLPLVIDVRDPAVSSAVINHPITDWRYRLTRRLEGWCYLQADAICAVTPELKQFISYQYRIDPTKITVVTNATNFKWLGQALSSNRPVSVFYAGTFASYQLIDQLVDLLLQLAPKRPKFQFTFFGYRGQPTDRLAFRVKQAKAESWIKLRPPLPRDQVLKKMSESAIVLVPIGFKRHPELYDYAIPLKLYEAIGTSRPILLFGGTKAARRLVRQTHIGLVCATTDDPFLVLTELVKHYDDYLTAIRAITISRKQAAIVLGQLLKQIGR